MALWRPASGIRLKALGLHWRNDRLLAARVRDDAGRTTGVRPLGGTVKFGETTADALRREFREELGIPVQIAGPPFFMENIFKHEDAQGHEILSIFEVIFPTGAFAGQCSITFREDCGEICTAEWFALDMLDKADGMQLYPSGLKERLVGSA